MRVATPSESPSSGGCAAAVASTIRSGTKEATTMFRLARRIAEHQPSPGCVICRLRGVFRWALLAPLCLLLTGCEGDRLQSALHPASPAASAVAQLWWVLLIILGLYTLAVFVLTLIAIFRRSDEDRPPPYGGRVFIVVGGIALPSLILIGLLFYSLTATAALRMPETGLTVRVVGHRWWWEIEYPGQGILTANEIVIPAGEPVRLELASADVIHSFWVPRLHGKMDLLPDHTTTFWIEADRPGTYRGQCAEFCGVQHARMAFLVEALPPEEFADWVARRQQAGDPQPEPFEQADPPEMAEPPATATAESDRPDRPDRPAAVDGPMPGASAVTAADAELAATEIAAARETEDPLRLGRAAFLRHGCAACHAIRGTRAVGRVGPDLSDVGSRQTLAAATVANTTENLISWIGNPETIKPGVNMPPTHAAAEEIRAIAIYLQSLNHERTPE